MIKFTEKKSDQYRKFIEQANYTSNFAIGDNVTFSHSEGEWTNGLVVGIRFTTAKVFYSIVDDYYGSLYNDIDSNSVREEDINVMAQKIIGKNLTQNDLNSLDDF
jgi:hypothetical protein